MSSVTLMESEQGVRVHVPMTFRKRSGRREIIVPDGLDGTNDCAPDYHEALVIAISRAHRWKKMLDEGRYRSIAECQWPPGSAPPMVGSCAPLLLYVSAAEKLD